jgi:AbrB family looped-hinge helix DNA binding protein
MASNTTLEYLTTTKIGEKGQVTVPKQFRHELRLGTGSPFAVLRLGNGLVLLPQQQRFEELCRRFSEWLANTEMTPQMLLATLPEARSRVYARRYGKKPVRRSNQSDSRKPRRK